MLKFCPPHLLFYVKDLGTKGSIVERLGKPTEVVNLKPFGPFIDRFFHKDVQIMKAPDDRVLLRG